MINLVRDVKQKLLQASGFWEKMGFLKKTIYEMQLKKKIFPPYAHLSNGNVYGNILCPERRFNLTINGKVRLIYFFIKKNIKIPLHNLI